MAMFRLSRIFKNYNETGSLSEQINLYGFIGPHVFLTKSGEVGVILELLEDLRRRLRGALRESLAHKVGAGRVEGTSGPHLRDGSEGTDGQRHPKDAEVMVVDLIPQPGVADLVEALELIEVDGIPVGHEHALGHDGQTGPG